MAFIKKGMATNTGGTVQKLDESQKSKLADAGLTLIPVSNDPSVLQNTQPSIKQVMPGISVAGFDSPNGNFLVLDENNVVHNVISTGPSLDNGGVKSTDNSGTPPTFPFNPDSFVPTSGGGGGTIIPTTPTFPAPLPPNNLGSGRIWTRFETGDIVPNQQETITRALWSGNVGNLLTFYTSSAQNATQQRYYYEIFNSGSGECGSEAQFSIAWGHKQGSGSADEGGQINDTPSRAIYGQYKQLCLEADEQRFVIGGTATDSIYVINVNRARMREFIDEGNLEINLQRLSGSQFLAGGGTQNAHTGSNVKVFPTQAVTRLVDDSRVASADVTTAGEVYNIVSGTLEDGIYNSSAPHYYGKLYRRLGVIVLDGNRLDMSASFLTVTGSEIPGDNSYKLFKSISGSALYTDASGDRLGFQGRSGEKVKSTHYFVRVKNQEYNFTNNPTFVTGSEGDLGEPTMIGNPQTYVTTVGLYNDNKDLLAVGKLSKPLLKNFTREALIKLKLEF
tara:strand:+ start:1427 stop:2941 length:1515 start_codon:yes stop_codon:yes gene_type:complete